MPLMAVLSANQYYFHNSATNTTTWENPREGPSSAAPQIPTVPIDSTAITNNVGQYGGIDPDLAYLDPSLRQSSTSSAPSYQARFNSRTGRFQGDPSMTPDRISEFKRGERQQEAFYDTASWQESLGGKGLKRSGIGEADGTGKPKKLTAKELVRMLPLSGRRFHFERLIAVVSSLLLGTIQSK